MLQIQLKTIFKLLLLVLMIIDNGNEISANLEHISSQQRKGFTDTQRKFQSEMLNAHNNYRIHHCAQALHLDDNLSHSAQNYAQKLAKMNTLNHSNTYLVGENLYMMSSSTKITTIAGSRVTSTWYDEMKKYDFNRAIFSSNTGHFTQLIWKNSKKLGVGFATGNSGHTAFIVAQYSPPGNVQGAFRANVSPKNC